MGIFFEAGQQPDVLMGIVTDDVKAAVIADDLEISVIRCQPPVLNRDHIDVACTHRQSPRGLFTPVAGITIDPDLHLSAGNDDPRSIALFFLLLLLHLPDLFYHLGHFLFHSRGECRDGFGEVVGHQFGLQRERSLGGDDLRVAEKNR